MGGRVQHTNPELHIPIFPRRGLITELIIRHFHETLAHVGATHVLASIRRQFWIVKGRAAVKHVLSKCVKCRMLYAPLCQQEITPLPKCRTGVGDFPFSGLWVRLFWPFQNEIWKVGV